MVLIDTNIFYCIVFTNIFDKLINLASSFYSRSPIHIVFINSIDDSFLTSHYL